MHRISSATLELPEDTLVILSFHFLFMRKPTPACPLLASEWYSRWPLWRVVNLLIIIIIIIMAGMAGFNVAGYLIEERRRRPVITASPRGQCSK